MTITELLWLFFGGVLGVAAAGAIPVAVALVERLLQLATRRTAQTLPRPNDWGPR